MGTKIMSNAIEEYKKERDIKAKGSSPFLTTYNLLVKIRKCHDHYE